MDVVEMLASERVRSYHALWPEIPVDVTFSFVSRDFSLYRFLHFPPSPSFEAEVTSSARPHVKFRAYDCSRLLCLSLTVLIAASFTPTIVAAQLAEGAVRSLCTIQEVSRNRLEVGPQRQMYVEAMAFSPSAESTLLAGAPSYLFGTHDAGPSELLARESIFGVLVSPDGKGVVIPAPIPASRIGIVRAASIGPQRWAVVFAEMAPGYDFTRHGTIAHLWFATLDRTGWSEREELPPELNDRINLAGASRVAYRNGDLVWAVRYGVLTASGIALFQRTKGR